MEHAHAAVAMMALAAAFASAAAAHVHEDAARAADMIGGGAGTGAGGAAPALHSHVGVGGGGPAVATLTVANAGRVALVSANATACGASGLLGRAAGDADWSLRPGAAASVSWAAPCEEGRAVLVRVEYGMADGTAAAEVHRACAGGGGERGAPPCAVGGAWGGYAGGVHANGSHPARPGEPEPPQPRPLPAPAIASCAVAGLSVTVCASGGPGGGGAEPLRIMRQLSPGPPGYALAGTVTPPAGGAAACHADAAPRNSAAAAYRVSAGAAGGQQERHSLPARADFAAQQCYVSTPAGERIGSPGGPPAPPPAARADYRIAMYAGLGSTPLTVEARFGPDRVVVERQPDGSWSRLGYHPSHPRDSLSEYLPAERVARGASGEADVRYVRADLLRHLDAFWGARQ